MTNLNELEEAIGYHFHNQELLIQALTHSSYANEKHMKPLSDNERLEFLGDAVLELVSSEFLYQNYPNDNEGKLSKLRASLVCEPTLSYCTEEMDLKKYIRLSFGEEKTGGRKRKSIRSDALDLDFRFAVIIPLVVSLFFYWATPKSAAVVMTGRVRSTTLAFLSMVPLVVLLIYHVFWRIAANLVETANLRQENELLGMQRKRYEELRTYMNETSALRHDFRQHLLAIQGYARNGETEKLSDYIASFSASLADHRGSFSANAAVDAVASHYDELSKLQNTEITWLLGLPETLPLPESDFITVFGNLVENALNAVKNLPEGNRNISVTVKMLSEAMLGITVKNPYEGVIKLNKNGLPKSGRPGHGIGFSSVEAVVHRYNGALEIDTSNGLFTVGALLYV